MANATTTRSRFGGPFLLCGHPLRDFAATKIRSILQLPDDPNAKMMVMRVLSGGLENLKIYETMRPNIVSKYDELRTFLEQLIERQWETDEKIWFQQFVQRQKDISPMIYQSVLTQMANNQTKIIGRDKYLSLTLRLIFDFTDPTTPKLDEISEKLKRQGLSVMQQYKRFIAIDENQQLFDTEPNPVYEALKDWVNINLQKELGTNNQLINDEILLSLVHHGWIIGLEQSDLKNNLLPEQLNALREKFPLDPTTDPPTTLVSPLTVSPDPSSSPSQQQQHSDGGSESAHLTQRPTDTTNSISTPYRAASEQPERIPRSNNDDKLELADLVQAGEFIYIDQQLSNIINQILNQHPDNASIIRQLAIPIMYLLKRHHNLDDFYQLFFYEYEQHFPHSTASIITMRMIIDELLRRADLSLSRKLLFLLSRRNPVPFLEPNMRFVPDIIHVWNQSKPMLLSFGLGSCQGKSILLNRIFLSSFESSSSPPPPATTMTTTTTPIDPYFNNTIDIDFGYHSNPQRPINIADAHGSMHQTLLQRIHLLFDAFLIHIRFEELQTHQQQLRDLLDTISHQQRYRLLIIRDVNKSHNKTCQEYLREKFPHENFFILPNVSNKDNREATFATNQLINKIYQDASNFSSNNRSHDRPQILFDLMDDDYKQHTQRINQLIQPLKTILNDLAHHPQSASTYFVEYLQYVELCRLKLQLARSNFYENESDDNIRRLRQDINRLENIAPSRGTSAHPSVHQCFVDILHATNMLACLDTLHTELRQERARAVSVADLAIDLPIHKNLTLEVLWRNTIVTSRHQSQADQAFLQEKYFDYIQAGYPFELIDGDNFALSYEFLSGTLAHLKRQERVLVLSVIGPQNSGKSTMLNHMFGTFFDVRDGRCTRGVYGSLIKANRPDFDSILLLDTEGLLGIERTDPEYDRRIVLFCLAVSHVVLVNVAREIDSTVQDMLRLCQESLAKMATNQTRRAAMHVILNQRVNAEIHHNLASIQAILNIPQDHFHTLPSAYQKDNLPSNTNLFAVVKTTSDFLEEVKLLTGRIFRSFDTSDVVDVSTWLSSSYKIFLTLQKCADLTYYKDIHERNLDQQLREQIRQRLFQLISVDYRERLIQQSTEQTQEQIQQTLHAEQTRIEQAMADEMDQVFRMLRANERLRQRNRQFSSVQIYGIFDALRVSIAEHRRRKQVMRIFQQAQEQLQQTIDMNIQHGSLMSQVAAQDQFDRIFSEKSDWIHRQFDVNARFDHAMDTIYQNYQIYEKECLIDKSSFKQECRQAIGRTTDHSQSDDELKMKISQYFTHTAYNEGSPVDANHFNPAENSFYSIDLIDTVHHLNREVLRDYHRRLVSAHHGTSTDDFQMQVREAIKNERPRRLENSRFDETRLFLSLSKLFDTVTARVMQIMQSGSTNGSMRQVHAELIQHVVGIVAALIVDVNDDLTPFCLKLSGKIKFHLHTLAMAILTRCHFYEQINHFQQLLAEFQKKKNDLKQAYVNSVSDSRSQDKASASSLMQHLRDHLIRSMVNDVQDMLRREMRQHDNIDRKYIQDRIDGQLATRNDVQWYRDYVRNPTRIIEQFFVDLWTQIRRAIDRKLNERKDVYVKMSQELFFCLHGVASHLRQRLGTSNQLIDQIFQADRTTATEFNDKGRCMMEVILIYLSEQRICSSVTIQDIRYRLTDAGQSAFQQVLTERKPSRELGDLIRPLITTLQSLPIGNVLLFLQSIADDEKKVIDDVKGIPCDFEHLDQDDSYRRMLDKVRGCQQLCPCCRRPCDVDHTRIRSQPGARDNQHQCRTGHNLRAMNGYKMEISNEPSLSMCEQIKDDQILEISKRRYRWSNFKEHHVEWNFESTLSEQELRILHGKFLAVWRRVGRDICQEYGMTYVGENRSLEIRHESFHYILVLDASGSMAGQRWIDLMKALEEFLTRRRALYTEDRVSIIVFSDRVERVIDNEDIRYVDIRAVRFLGGGTSFSLAFEEVRHCVKYYTGQSRLNRVHERFGIIFMSDGEADYPKDGLKRLLAKYQSYIKRFWTVTLSDHASTPPAVLQRINQTMNGSFMDVRTSVDLIKAYAEIASDRVSQR